MYPISDKFADAITRSHNIVTKVEVYSSGSLETTLVVSDGNITIDATNAIRRRANIVCNDPSITPHDAQDLLHPLSSNEIKLYRGLRFHDGSEELIPQGIFGIEDSDIIDSKESFSIRLKTMDRSRHCQRQRFTHPYHILPGENFAVAIRNLIESVLPNTTFNFMTTDLVTGSMTFGHQGWAGGGDPWEAARDMAQSIGAELFFDEAGVCVLRSIPDVSQDPIVWYYHEGPNSMILNLDLRMTKDEVYNHVIVIGVNSTNEDDPIRAEAIDDDPTSPTYIGDPPGSSKFGDVPTFFRSEMIRNESQAQQVADALLRQKQGTPQKIYFNAVVNPGHDAGDIISLSRERINLYGRNIIDRINIPLTAANISNVSCRERRD